jgi:hypothetical protein
MNNKAVRFAGSTLAIQLNVMVGLADIIRSAVARW